MHLQIKYTSIAFIVLTILDLCLSVPNLADQTVINHNGNSIFSNNNRKLTVNSKQLLVDSKNVVDEIIDHSDKSETNALFQRKNDDDGGGDKNDRSASASSVIIDADDSQSNASSDIDHPNFLITNQLSDGEIERRIQFNEITAKETFVPNHRYVFDVFLMDGFNHFFAYLLLLQITKLICFFSLLNQNIHKKCNALFSLVKISICRLLINLIDFMFLLLIIILFLRSCSPFALTEIIRIWDLSKENKTNSIVTRVSDHETEIKTIK